MTREPISTVRPVFGGADGTDAPKAMLAAPNTSHVAVASAADQLTEVG